MKKVLLFALTLFLFFACKKSNDTPSTSHVNGVLHYDYLVGKLGVYYKTDSNEIMLFKNNFGSDSLLYDHYKLFANLNTTLYYIDNGDTACYTGLTTICGLPLVEIVEFQIR